MRPKRGWRAGVPGIVAVAAGVMLGAVTPAAVGQEEAERAAAFAPGTEFQPLSFAEAVEESKKRHRLLLVYLYNPAHRETAVMDATTWQSPTLAAFVKWRCIAIKQPMMGGGAGICREYPVRDGLSGMGSPVQGRLPAVKIYKGDEELACLPTLESGLKSFGWLGLSTAPAVDHRNAVADIVPSSTNVLVRTANALDALMARDPVWGELHERRNPMPEAPEMPGPFYKMEDGLGDIIEDEAGGEPPADVWGRLELARRAVEVGNLHYATGLYTWLWEKGMREDPALRPARRSFLAAEMSRLARRRPGARERFEAIRDGHSARMLWADDSETLDWCVLNSIVGDDTLTIDWFTIFLVDEHEATMIPRSRHALLDLMLSRPSFADPLGTGEGWKNVEEWEGEEERWEPTERGEPGTPEEKGAGNEGGAERVERLAAYTRRSQPLGMPTPEWEELLAAARELLLDEACRLHVAALARGNEDEAQRIATTLLRAQNTSGARHAVVATALVAGVGREVHAKLLDEAEGMGVPRPDLREQLRKTMDGSPE